MRKLILLLVLVSTFLLTGMSGCKTTETSVKPKDPPKIWWGKAGEQPSEVWQNYDWVIVAKGTTYCQQGE